MYVDHDRLCPSRTGRRMQLGENRHVSRLAKITGLSASIGLGSIFVIISLVRGVWCIDNGQVVIRRELTRPGPSPILLKGLRHCPCG